MPAWQRLGRDAVRVWTLADPSMVSRYAVQMALGVPVEHAYRDHRALLLREKPDFAVISTPHTLHERIALDCIQAGIPVLVEKPMAATMAAAERMVAASEKAGIPLAVIHNYGARPQGVLALKLLEDGAIGRPFLYRSESLGMGWQIGAEGFDRDWRTRFAVAGGGCLLDNGYHAVYAALAMLGPVESVYARVGTFQREIETDDTALLLLTHACGGTSSLQVAWSANGESMPVNEIHGSAGTLRFEADGTVAVSRSGRDWDRHHAPADAGFQAVFERFLESVHGHGVPLTTGRQSMEALKVVRAAYASAQRGEVVRMREFVE